MNFEHIKLMSSHWEGQGKKPCQKEPMPFLSGFSTQSEHGLEMSLDLTVEEVMGKIKNCDLEFVYEFHGLSLYSWVTS